MKLRPLASNMTEVETMMFKVLFSYSTLSPVMIKAGAVIFVQIKNGVLQRQGILINGWAV